MRETKATNIRGGYNMWCINNNKIRENKISVVDDLIIRCRLTV